MKIETIENVLKFLEEKEGKKITSLQKELELLRELNAFIDYNYQEEIFMFENEIFETHV